MPVDYLFVDDSPSGGWNYYRLKQVDIDGRSKLFQIKAVNISIRSLRITPKHLHLPLKHSDFAGGLYSLSTALLH